MQCLANDSSLTLGWQVFNAQWLPYPTPNITVQAILERRNKILMTSLNLRIEGNESTSQRLERLI